MAKKKKVPSSSQLTARKTEAPMLVTRPAEEPKVVATRPVEELKVVATRPVEEPKVAATRPLEELKETPAIGRDEIARLAFAKFAARGYGHGHAVTDWLAAEAELRATKN